MEQKLLFMTNFLNLTKQIELGTQQDEVAFGTAFELRQDNMNRIDKCNALIKSSASLLSEQQKPALARALGGNLCGDETLDAIAELVLKYNAMLSSAQKLDIEATTAFKGRYSELRDKLNTIRKSKQANNEPATAFRRFT